MDIAIGLSQVSLGESEGVSSLAKTIVCSLTDAKEATDTDLTVVEVIQEIKTVKTLIENSIIVEIKQGDL